MKGRRCWNVHARTRAQVMGATEVAICFYLHRGELTGSNRTKAGDSDFPIWTIDASSNGMAAPMTHAGTIATPSSSSNTRFIFVSLVQQHHSNIKECTSAKGDSAVDLTSGSTPELVHVVILTSNKTTRKRN